MSDRYERQSRLREVGAAGQARIEGSEARIARGPAARVELAYLVRAGVERAHVASAVAHGFPHEAWFRFSAPARVAEGASRALDHLLHCLEHPELP
jgi:hypothetical protein